MHSCLTSVYNGPSHITLLQNKPKRVAKHKYKFKTRFLVALSSEVKGAKLAKVVARQVTRNS